MTYFMMDMEADGVEVRPLRQITGEGEFNEVYLTESVFPTPIGSVNVVTGGECADDIHERTRRHRRQPGSTQLWRDRRVLDVWAETGGTTVGGMTHATLGAAEAARLTNRGHRNRTTGTPGPEGSTAKLVYAELNKKIYEIAIELLGAEGMLYDTYEFNRKPDPSDEALVDIRRRFLRARANSIEGGTSEIMKNILGEQVLGLPGEPRVDKAVAWKDVPRS